MSEITQEFDGGSWGVWCLVDGEKMGEGREKTGGGLACAGACFLQAALASTSFLLDRQ
jgi:hypothetical protein